MLRIDLGMAGALYVCGSDSVPLHSRNSFLPGDSRNPSSGIWIPFKMPSESSDQFGRPLCQFDSSGILGIAQIPPNSSQNQWRTIKTSELHQNPQDWPESNRNRGGTDKTTGLWWETWCARNEETCDAWDELMHEHQNKHTHTHNLNTHFLTIHAQGFEFEVSRYFIKYSDALS